MSDNNENEKGNENENQKNDNVKDNVVIEGEVEYTNDKSIYRIIEKYGGAIIGGIIALLLCFTRLYMLVIALLVIIAGIFLGNYIQKNKSDVKTKLKDLIDKF